MLQTETQILQATVWVLKHLMPKKLRASGMCCRALLAFVEKGCDFVLLKFSNHLVQRPATYLAEVAFKKQGL